MKKKLFTINRKKMNRDFFIKTTKLKFPELKQEGWIIELIVDEWMRTVGKSFDHSIHEDFYEVMEEADSIEGYVELWKNTVAKKYGVNYE